MRIFKASVAAAVTVSVVGIGVALALAVRAVGKSLDAVTWTDEDDEPQPEATFDLDPVADFEKNCRELLERWGLEDLGDVAAEFGVDLEDQS